MARRRRRRRFEDIELDLGITNDELMADLDPGWNAWRQRGAAIDPHD